MTDARIRPHQNEAIEAFLARAIPSQTPCHAADWIQVSHNSISSNSDNNIGNIPCFCEESAKVLAWGREQLACYKDRKESSFSSSSSSRSSFASTSSSSSKSLSKSSSKSNHPKITKKAIGHAIRSQLLVLAYTAQVLVGKWLLFPRKGVEADAVWKIIATATVQGRLGTSAKIATHDALDPNPNTLICVYTKSCIDVEDILRVFDEMKVLGVVVDGASGTDVTGANGKCYSYKPDCLTYAGIYGNNEYGVDPVLYRMGGKTPTNWTRVKEIGVIAMDSELGQGMALSAETSIKSLHSFIIMEQQQQQQYRQQQVNGNVNIDSHADTFDVWKQHFASLGIDPRCLADAPCFSPP